MENTQRICILCGIVLSWNCLMTEDEARAANKTFDYKCCWINPTYIF